MGWLSMARESSRKASFLTEHRRSKVGTIRAKVGMAVRSVVASVVNWRHLTVGGWGDNSYHIRGQFLSSPCICMYMRMYVLCMCMYTVDPGH